MNEKKSITVLVTGSTGMIGSHVVDGLIRAGFQVIGGARKPSLYTASSYKHIQVDLSNTKAVEQVFEENQIDRVVHLAALAHTVGEKNLSYERYYLANVKCSKNVFIAAVKQKIPILFSSTTDVYGFVKGVATANKKPHPVTDYGKTKFLAEQELQKICKSENCEYVIFRFAPVYTNEIKRDIQKRYYIKYPDWAFFISNGTEYEFLCIKTAVQRIIGWVGSTPTGGIFNIRDEKLVNTLECLITERNAGRAKHIFHFPRWLIIFGFGIIKTITGENKYTYLLNKAVNPIRTE